MADLTVFTFGDEPFISIRQSQGDEADELIRVHPDQVEVLIGWLRQAADELKKRDLPETIEHGNNDAAYAG